MRDRETFFCTGMQPKYYGAKQVLGPQIFIPYLPWKKAPKPAHWKKQRSQYYCVNSDDN